MDWDNLEDIERKLKRYNQEHLISYYSKIQDENIKLKFENQLKNIDYELIDSLYKKTTIPIKEENANIEPIDYWDKERLGGKYDFYEEIGVEAIKSGKLAAVTMAGGQGTRLGHDGPKGTYFIKNDGMDKSIFQILTEIMKKGRKTYQVDIPWYIMTSEENHEDTVRFFRENDCFGYPKGAIMFFRQAKLPMFDEEGKILVGEDKQIKQAADGHGGVFDALRNSGCIKDMKRRGVEWNSKDPNDRKNYINQTRHCKNLQIINYVH